MTAVGVAPLDPAADPPLRFLRHSWCLGCWHAGDEIGEGTARADTQPIGFPEPVGDAGGAIIWAKLLPRTTCLSLNSLTTKWNRVLQRAYSWCLPCSSGYQSRCVLSRAVNRSTRVYPKRKNTMARTVRVGLVASDDDQGSDAA